MTKKIMFIFGTRPEAIKMCPVILKMQNDKSFQIIITVTGQHREMLDQVLSVFHIKPTYDLAIMHEGQSLTDITCTVLTKLDSILTREKPDIVLVHGDTTTCLAASLAAFYHQIKLGHIEAGLRSFDKFSPYPEEMNRTLTSTLADFHFAPTETARQNLLREGKKAETIFVTGNTVIDSMNYTVNKNFQHPILTEIASLEKKTQHKQKIILLTAHRRENQGTGIRQIFHAVRRIANDFPDIHIVFPVHLNPTIQQLARQLLSRHKQIHLIPPLDVVGFHNFESRAFLILTDSGGVQEEAPHFGVPVLVLRNTTERPEGVTAGTLKLVGTDEQTVYSNVAELIKHPERYDKMSGAKNPYGDGHASERIISLLNKELHQKH